MCSVSQQHIDDSFVEDAKTSRSCKMGGNCRLMLLVFIKPLVHHGDIV